jgi:adenine-specific DNA-methyltransferase
LLLEKNEIREEFPIKIISEADQKPFIDLVDRILAIKNENPEIDTKDLENEIDQLVYRLYELTDAEIKIVEGSVG